MGIRFYCPNGHKLNVKTEQAGKVGYCPDCGARVQIPFESTRPSSRHHSDARNDAESSLDDAVSPPAASADPADPVQPAPSAPLPESSVSWYMQGGDGRKYGPVDTQTIHSWISEYRVAATTMVWREGWSEWKEAKDVFPEFNVPAVPPAIRDLNPEPAENASSVLPQAVLNTHNSETAAKAKLLKKKQKAFRELIMVVVLSVIILILAIVLLLLVLGSEKKEESTAPSEPPPASAPQTSADRMADPVSFYG